MSASFAARRRCSLLLSSHPTFHFMTVSIILGEFGVQLAPIIVSPAQLDRGPVFGACYRRFLYTCGLEVR